MPNRVLVGADEMPLVIVAMLLNGGYGCNTVFDFAPLWRSGIGFDHLFDTLRHAAQPGQADNYPPYDIEGTGENTRPSRLDARSDHGDDRAECAGSLRSAS